MSTTVSNVALSLNLVTLKVDLHSSVDSKAKGTGLSNFCDGGGKVVDGKTVKHPPTKINQIYRCPTCRNEDKTTFIKGRPEGKGWVMVSEDTVAEAAATAEPFTKNLEFTYHEAKDVEANMVAIDAPYYVSLNGVQAGAPAEVYCTLADWIQDNPDVALLTRFAPRTSVATFRLTVRQGMLMLQKLCFPADLLAAPAVPSNPERRYRSQLDEMIRSQVEAFDPTQWVNQRREILASASGSLTEVSGEPATATVMDISELLRLSTKAKRARKSRMPKSKSA